MLPPFAFGDTGAGADPDVTTGSYTGMPSDFVAGLIEANPAWTVETTPEPDAAGRYDFEMHTPSRAARVTAEQDTTIVGRVVTAFSIAYRER